MSFASQLRADCAKCCGLCCVGPAFDADQGFGFDKPAHTACCHLDAAHRCTIHAQLRLRGFPACASFECYGAGQWVTQHLFAGKSWRTSPELAARMFTVYRKVRMLHELLVLLDVAMVRLPPEDAGPLAMCVADLRRICAGGEHQISSVNERAVRARVRHLLQAHRGPLLR